MSTRRAGPVAPATTPQGAAPIPRADIEAMIAAAGERGEPLTLTAAETAAMARHLGPQSALEDRGTTPSAGEVHRLAIGAGALGRAMLARAAELCRPGPGIGDGPVSRGQAVVRLDDGSEHRVGLDTSGPPAQSRPGAHGRNIRCAEAWIEFTIGDERRRRLNTDVVIDAGSSKGVREADLYIVHDSDIEPGRLGRLLGDGFGEELSTRLAMNDESADMSEYERLHEACDVRAVQALATSVEAGDIQALVMLAERHLLDAALDESATYEITIRDRVARGRRAR